VINVGRGFYREIYWSDSIEFSIENMGFEVLSRVKPLGRDIPKTRGPSLRQ
jgi:hypothetical protein